MTCTPPLKHCLLTKNRRARLHAHMYLTPTHTQTHTYTHPHPHPHPYSPTPKPTLTPIHTHTHPHPDMTFTHLALVMWHQAPYHFRCRFAFPMSCLGFNPGHERVGLSGAASELVLKSGNEFEWVEWDNMVIMVCCQYQNSWVLARIWYVVKWRIPMTYVQRAVWNSKLKHWTLFELSVLYVLHIQHISGANILLRPLYYLITSTQKHWWRQQRTDEGGEICGALTSKTAKMGAGTGG